MNLLRSATRATNPELRLDLDVLTATVAGLSPLHYRRDDFVAVGDESIFTASSSFYEGSVQVFLDGAIVSEDDYVVSGNMCTLDTPASADEKYTFLYWSVSSTSATTFTVAGETYSFWNPSDKAASVALSDSNKLATKTGGGGSTGWVRSVASHSSGKFQVELEFETFGTTSGGGFAITGDPGSYGGSNGIAWVLWGNYGSDVRLYHSASMDFAEVFNLSNGSVMTLLIDLDAGTCDYRIDNVDLSNTSSFLTGDPYFIFAETYGGSAIRLRSPAEMTGTPLSGYHQGWPD